MVIDTLHKHKIKYGKNFYSERPMKVSPFSNQALAMITQ